MERDRQFTVNGSRFIDFNEQTTAPTRMRGYDVDIDIADFLRGQENPQILAARKKHDLETMLGERFNVEIAQTTYNINNGQLHHSEFAEPFTDRIRLGIEYRRGRNSPDFERERAELEGFLDLESQIQNSQPGTKFVIISPPGINYPKKFFDIYQRVDNDIVQSSRYTSTLSNERLLAVAAELDIAWQAASIANPNQTPTDAHFLRSPIKTSLPTEKILEKFHPEKDTLQNAEYKKLLEAAAPIILVYLAQLECNPQSQDVYKNFNALLNFADNWVLNPQNRQSISQSTVSDIPRVINELAILPVRPVMAGCGLQTAYETANGQAPYSVADYAPTRDKFGTLEIHCEECGAKYNRTPNKLEEKCKRCGGIKGIKC